MNASDAIGTIDHVVITVPSLEPAAETYRRLGFTLSPRGVHSAALGSANHTIMLRDDYFELLTVLAPTERNVRWRRAIAEGGGISGLAMTTIDPPGARDIWKSAGLAPDEPIKFSRQVARPDGNSLEARFEVVSLADVPGVPVRVFVCSQPTREAVWLPELLGHANAAVAIRRLTVACPNPGASAAQWKRILPAAVAAPVTAGVRIDTGRHSIDLIPGNLPEARTTGIDFAVSDIGKCRVALQSGGIAFREARNRLEIAPEDACNVRVGFEAAP